MSPFPNKFRHVLPGHASSEAGRAAADAIGFRRHLLTRDTERFAHTDDLVRSRVPESIARS